MKHPRLQLNKRAFWCGVAVLVLLRCGLTSFQQAYTWVGGAPLDDELMFRAAQAITAGEWLGAYDYLTLSKAMFFPVWLALLHALHLPYLISGAALWCGAALLAAFMAVTGGTTGVLLFFRLVVLVCKAAMSYAFYREFRRDLGGRGALLAALCEEAVRRDYDVTACPSTEEPGRLEHLLIPELGVAFVTSKPGMVYPGKPYRRVRLDALSHPENKARLRFRARMTGVLREEAIAALQEAKAAHDLLEGVYNPYVDFEGVRAQAALEAGRLLSWMK